MQIAKNSLQQNVAIVGNLGSTITISKNSRGHKLAKFSVARNSLDLNPTTPNKWKTDWYILYAYGDMANFVQSNLKSGQKVTVTGKLVKRTEIRPNGRKRKVSEVEVRSIEEIN